MYAIMKLYPPGAYEENVGIYGVTSTRENAYVAVQDALIDTIQNDLPEDDKNLYTLEFFQRSKAAGGKWHISGLTSPEGMLEYLHEEATGAIEEAYVFNRHGESCIVVEVRQVWDLDKVYGDKVLE